MTPYRLIATPQQAEKRTRRNQRAPKVQFSVHQTNPGYDAESAAGLYYPYDAGPQRALYYYDGSLVETKDEPERTYTFSLRSQYPEFNHFKPITVPASTTVSQVHNYIAKHIGVPAKKLYLTYGAYSQPPGDISIDEAYRTHELLSNVSSISIDLIPSDVCVVGSDGREFTIQLNDFSIGNEAINGIKRATGDWKTDVKIYAGTRPIKGSERISTALAESKEKCLQTTVPAPQPVSQVLTQTRKGGKFDFDLS